MPEITGGSLHARFFVLAGRIRHEYWLHEQRAEDHRFEADADAMTLRARHQDGLNPCVMKVAPEELEGDLHAVARHFYKNLCGGHGRLTRRKFPRARTA